MTLQVNLDSNVGIVNFSAPRGTDTALLVTLSTVADLTLLTFDVSIYTQRPEVKTTLITELSGIIVDNVGKTLILPFTDLMIAGYKFGAYHWDLRYSDSLSVTKQIIKGTVTIGAQ